MMKLTDFYIRAVKANTFKLDEEFWELQIRAEVTDEVLINPYVEVNFFGNNNKYLFYSMCFSKSHERRKSYYNLLSIGVFTNEKLQEMFDGKAYMLKLIK